MAQDSLFYRGKQGSSGLGVWARKRAKLLTQKASRGRSGLCPRKDKASGNRKEREQRQKLCFAFAAHRKEETHSPL